MAPKKSSKPAAKRSARQINAKSSNGASKNGASAAERLSRGRAVASRNSRGKVLRATNKTSGTTNKKTADVGSDSGASQDELPEDEVDPDWEVDDSMDFLEELGKDVLPNIKFVRSLQTRIPMRDGSEADGPTKFAVGDRIWILPDKHSSANVPRNCDKIEDLPDEAWDVGEIVNCCHLTKQLDSSPGDGNPIGFLEVVWLYTYKEILALKDVNLHSYWVDRVKKYKLGPDERILTDHHDFVPLSSFAGFAEDIYAHLDLSGLFMSLEDRLSDPKDRKQRSKKDEDAVKIHGFNRRTMNYEVFATEEALIAAPDPPEEEEEEKKKEDRKRGFKPAKKRRRRERDHRVAVDEEEDELQTPAPKQAKKKSRR